MHSIIGNTFGGMSKSCYFRHFFFGLFFVGIIGYLDLQKENRSIIEAVILIANAFLYPYSRFVYESVVGFILGENIFILNAFVMLIGKLFTMIICFMFAIFIAPIGLIYLYYSNTKKEQ